MKRVSAKAIGLALGIVALMAVSAPAFAGGNNNNKKTKLAVNASTFDPYKTNLVAAEWINGIGCPTNAKEVKFDINPPYNLLPPSSFTDAACVTGDPSDKKNAGLLLVKTAETLNDASAGADVTGVKGIVLSEVGYDLRHGSHCGAGAPRFNITTTTGKSYFLGCNSPAPDSTTPGDGFDRRRWGNGTPGSVSAYLNGSSLEPITDPVKTMSIVFDEGQDVAFAGDTIGVAIIDNIDINGSLIGNGN